MHGGGFYHQQKYPVSPALLPDKLHWSMWESYSTWLTGFALFAVLYLFNASTFLIDKTVFDWSPTAAIATSLAFFVAFWLIYDGICRVFGERENGDLIVGVLVFAFIVFAAWLSCRLFAGRAAFLLVGAMMATTMTANVLMVIIPGQRKVVAALRAGAAGRSGARPARQAAQRAQHLLHAAGRLHDDQQPLRLPLRREAELAGAGGADARRRPDPRLVRAAPQGARRGPAGAVELGDRRHARGGVTVAALLPSPHRRGAPGRRRRRPSPQVQAIVAERCQMCHNAAMPSKNVRLDSPEAIAAHAQQVYQQVVVLKLMPLNNATRITDAERVQIRRWFEAGAPAR